MSETGGKMLLDRWVEDTGFRQQMRSDPMGAVATIGADLDEKELEFLRSVDWTLSDEELEALLNGPKNTLINVIGWVGLLSILYLMIFKPWQ